MPRRRRTTAVLVLSSLALAGCTTTVEPDPDSSTPAPTATRPADDFSAEPLMSYPVAPTPLWTFAAGLDQPDGADGTLYDPSRLNQTSEGFVGAAPIDAGDAWITAIRDPDGFPVLLGVSPGTGEQLWIYQPERGEVTTCAGVPVAGSLACAVTDRADTSGEGSAVVLLDVLTGSEQGRIDLPLAASSIRGTGSDVVVLLAPPTTVAEGEQSPRTYRVGRYSATGEERWTTDVVHTPSELGRGPWEAVDVGATLVGVEIDGAAYVLDAADGDLLLERSGLGWGVAPTPDGALLVDSAPSGDPAVTVLAADGSEIMTLTGHAWLPTLVPDDDGPALLLAPDGTVVELDTATGGTTATGVSPGSLVYGLSKVGTTMLVLDDFTVRGYDLGSPGAPAWEVQRRGPMWIHTDGELLYSTGLAADGAAAGGETQAPTVVALGVADGVQRWAFSPAPSRGPGEATLARAGGHLVLVDGPELTALAP